MRRFQTGLWEDHHTKQREECKYSCSYGGGGGGVGLRKRSGVVVSVCWEEHYSKAHWILECLGNECRFQLIVISRVTAFEQRNEERQFGDRLDRFGQEFLGTS